MFKLVQIAMKIRQNLRNLIKKVHDFILRSLDNLFQDIFVYDPICKLEMFDDNPDYFCIILEIKKHIANLIH